MLAWEPLYVYNNWNFKIWCLVQIFKISICRVFTSFRNMKAIKIVFSWKKSSDVNPVTWIQAWVIGEVDLASIGGAGSDSVAYLRVLSVIRNGGISWQEIIHTADLDLSHWIKFFILPCWKEPSMAFRFLTTWCCPTQPPCPRCSECVSKRVTRTHGTSPPSLTCPFTSWTSPPSPGSSSQYRGSLGCTAFILRVWIKTWAWAWGGG